MAKASTPEPFSTSKTSNWVAKVGGLPPYIQHVAHDLMDEGHSESKAIGMAVGIIKNWAHGHDGKGGTVHPDTQAAAAKALAEWEEKKARAHLSFDTETPLDVERYTLALSQGLIDAGILDVAGQVGYTLNMTIFKWDPNEHPRDLLGKFAEKLEGMQDGGKVMLPDGMTVTKKGGRYRVGIGDMTTPSSFKKPESAAAKALDYSAASKHPDSLGGDISYSGHKDVADTPIQSDSANPQLFPEEGTPGASPSSIQHGEGDVVRHKDSPDTPEHAGMVTKVHNDGTIDVVYPGMEGVGAEQSTRVPASEFVPSKEKLTPGVQSAVSQLNENEAIRKENEEVANKVQDFMGEGAGQAVRSSFGDQSQGNVEWKDLSPEERSEALGFLRGELDKPGSVFEKGSVSEDTVRQAVESIEQALPGQSESPREVKAAIGKHFTDGVVDLTEHKDGSFSWTSNGKDYTLEHEGSEGWIATSGNGAVWGDTAEEAVQAAAIGEWDHEINKE